MLVLPTTFNRFNLSKETDWVSWRIWTPNLEFVVRATHQLPFDIENNWFKKKRFKMSKKERETEKVHRPEKRKFGLLHFEKKFGTIGGKSSKPKPWPDSSLMSTNGRNHYSTDNPLPDRKSVTDSKADLVSWTILFLKDMHSPKGKRLSACFE